MTDRENVVTTAKSLIDATALDILIALLPVAAEAALCSHEQRLSPRERDFLRFLRFEKT